MGNVTEAHFPTMPLWIQALMLHGPPRQNKVLPSYQPTSSGPENLVVFLDYVKFHQLTC